MALEVQVQQDFSGGMYQSPARELIPANGCAKIVNGLLEVDGSVSRRGGTTALFTDAGLSGGIVFAWDGNLGGGPTTILGTPTKFSVVNSTDTGNVLTYTTTGLAPVRPAVGNAMAALLQADGLGVLLYAGSRNVSSTIVGGNITATVGSATVTGSGTTWQSGTAVVPGMIVQATDFFGVVQSVESNTSLTLTVPATSALTGSAYVIGGVYRRSFASQVSSVAAVSNPARLVTASGSTVAFSSAGSFLAFDATDYHVIPQGAQVLGMETLRNVLFVFTTQGVFTISGMDYDLTDAQGNVQQRLEQINRDIILWDQRGITGWSGALIVPGVDDVYLLTESAAPRALSEPIRTLYRGYVAAGYQCGGATVYRNHFFLPILNGATWVDTLVCRLDAGGWVQWSGTGVSSAWYVTRGTTATVRRPRLLSMYGTRVDELTGCFSPTAANKNDSDGSTHPFEVVTRDYTTGGLRANLVKKVRLGYELTDAAADSPTITAQYATGNTASYTSLAGSATVSDGQAAAPFTVGTARPRFIRFRFSSVAPAAKMQVKSVEVLSRSGGRQ